MDILSLEGRVAIITGASRGIGLEIAKYMAKAGAKVVLTSRTQADLDTAAAEITSAGGTAVGIAAHMGNSEAVNGLVAKVVEQYGRVDIVVNNAAANPVFAPLHKVEDEAFDKIFSVNLKGPWLLAKAALAEMRKVGGGSIINISSIGGLKPEPGLGLYSASKSAIISLTESMAQDWGRYNVRANAVCPGLIKTKFAEAMWKDEKIMAHFNSRIPLGRAGEPDDIAGLVLFLASEASKYCTGGTFVADGGYLLG